MIEKEKIEEIKRQTDIVGLISQYVPLKKVGKNYRANCPFHNEKDPSFYVVPEKGIFHCFGCRKGGNAITFLMEYEKLDFPAAVKRLAKNLGIEIDTTRSLKYKELYDVNDLAAHFYTLCLSRDVGKRGAQYIAARRIPPPVIKEFRIGYAPASGGLVTFMRQKGIAQERMTKAGLLGQSGRPGTNRDLFRDRIIFPIHNVSGRIIGFGGRSIDDMIKPKYLNSPETPIFKKSEVLYGLYQAKDVIRTKSEAVLVEGYFDLLNLFGKGITHLCAPLGTALTENQALLLSRFARKVFILFDGDVSGIKAALRAIGLLIQAQIDVYVTSLPENMDPDKYVNEYGGEKLRELMESSLDFFHFYKKIVKTETVEQEIILIKDIVQIVSTINDEIRLDRYLKYAARVFDIPVETLVKAMNKEKPVKKPAAQQSSISQEEQVMVMILNQKEYHTFAREILTPDDFENDNLARVYKLYLKDESFDIADLSDVTSIDADLKEKLLAAIVNEIPLSKEAFVDALIKYRSMIEEKKIQKKIAVAEEQGDTKAVTRYQNQHKDLKQRMLKIRVDMDATKTEA